MSKARSFSSPRLSDEATKKEINRQHALLSADMDKKQLRGNVTLEEWRHYKQATTLNQKEKREHFQIKSRKKELLNDLQKVRSSYTGHFDASKSPMENIQLALRTKCQTPPRNSRLYAPGVHGIRRCKSSEVLSSPSTRASSSLSYSPNPLLISSRDKVKERPKTAAAEVAPLRAPKRQDDPKPTASKKKQFVKAHKKT
ncbi:uncharacterized protein LOC116298661 [Actinia tenebrosa]|uniref:Uncharacterized protein LOC116298661 n=1 Tax=Actinia tenebrosa TaxID=6105 RepID=A0A6P8ICX8_ACTTE|nr:uncharacterized protein LOC116298661 [Actinia tenebrosa]